MCDVAALPSYNCGSSRAARRSRACRNLQQRLICCFLMVLLQNPRFIFRLSLVTVFIYLFEKKLFAWMCHKNALSFFFFFFMRLFLSHRY